MFRKGNLMFRLPELTDADDIHKMRNDEIAVESLGGFSVGMTLDAARKWVVDKAGSGNDIVFVISSSDYEGIIGHVGLYKIDHRIRSAEFAILIGNREFWGRGFGRIATLFALNFAFLQLNLNRVSLQVLASNTKAISLYEKIGFQREGVLREAQFKYGKYLDVIEMSILKAEYQE